MVANAEEPHDHRWAFATYVVQGKYNSSDILEEVDERTIDNMTRAKRAKLERFHKKLYSPVDRDTGKYELKIVVRFVWRLSLSPMCRLFKDKVVCFHYE